MVFGNLKYLYTHLQENVLNMNQNELHKNSAIVDLKQNTAASVFQTFKNIVFSLTAFTPASDI